MNEDIKAEIMKLLNDDFKAELRNVIRFMNSENVEIDEETIRQFGEEFPTEEPAHVMAVMELEREIWAALDEVKPTRYFAGVDVSLRNGIISKNPDFEWLLDELEAENMKETHTWYLCIKINRLITNSRQEEYLKTIPND